MRKNAIGDEVLAPESTTSRIACVTGEIPEPVKSLRYCWIASGDVGLERNVWIAESAREESTKNTF